MPFWFLSLASLFLLSSLARGSRETEREAARASSGSNSKRTGREHLVDERDCVEALVVKRVGLSPLSMLVSVNTDDARWRGTVVFDDG